MTRACDELYRQLDLLRVVWGSIVVSTNVELRQDGQPYANRRRPDDCGAAVYFRRGDQDFALACDSWDRVEDNIWAIAKHLDAMRGQERWGVGSLDQAFTGYAALPETASEGKRPWRSVFDVAPDWAPDWAAVRTRYRTLAMHRHPDQVGGSDEAMAELARALEDAKVELKIA